MTHICVTRPRWVHSFVTQYISVKMYFATITDYRLSQHEYKHVTPNIDFQQEWVLHFEGNVIKGVLRQLSIFMWDIFCHDERFYRLKYHEKIWKMPFKSYPRYVRSNKCANIWSNGFVISIHTYEPVCQYLKTNAVKELCGLPWGTCW